MEYNKGNFEKYVSKNPLKRKMVEKFNLKIVSIVEKMTEEIKLQGGGATILDAGCGEGFIDNILLENINSIKIKGLEYTREALEIAKEMNPKAEYIQGDICNMPFADDFADIIICTEVLEHLKQPEKAVHELLRVGKKYVLITVPDEPWFCMGNLVALKNIRRFGNPIDHINHWTYRKFKRFVTTQFDGKINFCKSFPWSIAVLNLEK